MVRPEIIDGFGLDENRLGIHSPRKRTLPSGEPNPDRKRPVVFVEIDRCATDAIGVVTGARVGKRALKLRDWGKMAATFVDLDAKLSPDEYKAIRIVALTRPLVDRLARRE